MERPYEIGDVLVCARTTAQKLNGISTITSARSYIVEGTSVAGAASSGGSWKYQVKDTERGNRLQGWWAHEWFIKTQELSEEEEHVEAVIESFY